MADVAAHRCECGRAAGGDGVELPHGRGKCIVECSGIHPSSGDRVHDYHTNDCGVVKWLNHHDNGCGRKHDDNDRRRRIHHDVDHNVGGRRGTSASAHGPNPDAGQLDEPGVHHHRRGLEYRLGLSVLASARVRTIV